LVPLRQENVFNELEQYLKDITEVIVIMMKRQKISEIVVDFLSGYYNDGRN
jgi:hypothetical protein